MAESLRRPAGWEDLLATPEGVKAEILAGELETSPRPHPAHGRAQAILSFNLIGPFDQDPAGENDDSPTAET